MHQDMAITIATVDAQLLSAHPPSQLEVRKVVVICCCFGKPKKELVIRSKETCIPPKFKIELETDGLEDVFPFPGVYSQVPCLSSRVFCFL